jgi:hypothetical protein
MGSGRDRGQTVTYYYAEVMRMRRRAFMTGALVGGVVIAVIWVTQWLLGAGGAENSVSSPSTEPRTQGAVAPTPSRLETCRAVFEAQEPLLDTFGQALFQWNRQIALMNKLVTRVITVQEALQFWAEARSPARTARARYLTAHEVFDERTARCPHPDDGQPSSDERRCSEAVAARDAQIRAAEAALASWQANVDDMRLLREDEISRDEVAAGWLTSGPASTKQLAVYRTAARAADGLTCPGADGLP